MDAPVITSFKSTIELKFGSLSIMEISAFAPKKQAYESGLPPYCLIGIVKKKPPTVWVRSIAFLPEQGAGQQGGVRHKKHQRLSPYYYSTYSHY